MAIRVVLSNSSSSIASLWQRELKEVVEDCLATIEGGSLCKLNDAQQVRNPWDTSCYLA